MTETDISKVLIEGEYATIMGVKYKRVESPKPPTLYDVIYEWYHEDATIDYLITKIKQWLPPEVIEDGEEYHNGWNDCLQHLKENIK
jgi:hypothetical protein